MQAPQRTAPRLLGARGTGIEKQYFDGSLSTLDYKFRS
jgi:hypothetical protein